MNSVPRKTRLSLRHLGSIVEEVNAERDLGARLEIAARRICETMRVYACGIYLTDAGDGRHTLSAACGLRKEAVGEVVLGPDEGLVGLVASELKPVNLADCSRHARFKYVPAVGEEPFHAFLVVPLIYHGKLLGILIVENRTPRRFTESAVSFLVTLAIHLADQVKFATITAAVVQAPGQQTGQWLHGVAAAPGIGLGTAVVLYSLTDMHALPEREASDPAVEETALLRAIEYVHRELEELAERAGETASQHAGLLSAYAMIVTSEELVGGALDKIKAGASAPSAFRSTIEELASAFDAMEDAYLRERGRNLWSACRTSSLTLQRDSPS